MESLNVQKNEETKLFEAVLKLKTTEECRQFFYDLCTPAEVDEFTARWHVARLLTEKKPYRQITNETCVSTTTVGRVARFIKHGHSGYTTILRRLGYM